MRLTVFTLCLDGMAFLPAQFFTLNRLTTSWNWVVVEGASNNGGSTSWCRPQDGRLSRDGSTEFLHVLRDHPRVRVIQRQQWASKDDMVQAALDTIKEPSCVLQVDCDEIWTHDQLFRISTLFDEQPHHNVAHFYCRYFVGPNLVIDHESDKRNNVWIRAWRGGPGMKCVRHEPPVMNVTGPVMHQDVTASMGLVYDHYSYLIPSGVKAKCEFYGYRNGLESWRKLQRHQKFPVRLKTLLPWSHSDSIVNPLHKP